MAKLGLVTLECRKKSNGMYFIYISISHDKATRYITTPYTVEDRKYLRNNEIVGCEGAFKMTKELHSLLDCLQNKLHSLDTRNMNCVQIKDTLLGYMEEDSFKGIGIDTGMSISRLFDIQIEEYKSDGKDSSARMYNDTKKAILKKLGNMPLGDLTKNDIDFLHDEGTADGFSFGGIQVKMSRFKSLLNKAVDNEWISYVNFPFNGYKMPRYKPKNMNVTLEEFYMLATHETVSKRVAFARDIFLLSFYLGGMNIADLMEIRLDGNTVDYERKKTRDVKQYYRHTRFNIPGQARPLIAKLTEDGMIKWPTVKRHDDILSYVNRGFRLLREETGIDSRLSSYTARKTFCQLAFELGVSEDTIKYCIGQTTGAKNTIYNYMRVMQQEADKAMQRIFEHVDFYLNENRRQLLAV